MSPSTQTCEIRWRANENTHLIITGRNVFVWGHLPDVACGIRRRSDLVVGCLSRRSFSGRVVGGARGRAWAGAAHRAVAVRR